MKISTSSSLFHKNMLENKYYTIEDSLYKCRESGFEYVDFNFYDHALPGQFLTKKDWKERLYKIKEYADEIGIEFNQTHAFCYRTKESTDTSLDHEWYGELMRRSIIGTRILGAKWTVVHPNSYQEEDYDSEKNFQFNHKFWQEYVTLAEDNKVGIAFENMFESSAYGRYCSSVDELIRLIDSYKSDYVGACWDTGHAHLANLDQRESIVKLGYRLKTLHINDNRNTDKKDEHLVPYFGTVDWSEVLLGLEDINYNNDFSYELKQSTQLIPIEMGLDFGKFLYKLAVNMVERV